MRATAVKLYFSQPVTRQLLLVDQGRFHDPFRYVEILSCGRYPVLILSLGGDELFQCTPGAE